MMNSSIPFHEEMYDYKISRLMDIVYHTPDKMSFIYIQFNHLQLGETDEWYIERAKDMNNPIKARREYLLEWINSNGNSPFDPDDIELISELTANKRTNFQIFKINKYYNLNVYSEYRGRKPVLIGVDVSGGRGRDSTAVVVANPETLMPMAFFRSNMIPSNDLKKLLVTLVTKRYPNCILTIENNSIGTPLIDHLRETVLNRVLYREKKKRTVDVGTNNATRKRKTESLEYGHNVNPVTRAQMMEMLETIVHNSPDHVAFPELYEEIRFLELKNGRIDHSSATHDDCTMAYMGLLWIVRYGTGLKGKSIYYTLGGEDDTEGYDTGISQEFARKVILEKKKPGNEDALVSYMKQPQHLEDSSTLAARERAEYFKELDRIEDVSIEDEITEAIDAIPDSTQRLMLRNYYAMLNQSNEYGGDPFRNLLDPDGTGQPNSLTESILSYRNW